MKAIFITGTDTGVGKTVVTGLLARYLSENGYSVITQKWVQTGSGRACPADIKEHLRFMVKDKADIKNYLSYIAPYTFNPACSPHLASKMEGKKIDSGKIKADFKFLSRRFDFVIVEGIGGALVPFSNKRLVIDIVKELKLPVLLVIGNKLGAINHALLAIEALKSRGLKIIGLVFNNLYSGQKYILKDNPAIVSKLSRQKTLGVLPKLGSPNSLYKKFLPVGRRILKSL